MIDPTQIKYLSVYEALQQVVEAYRSEQYGYREILYDFESMVEVLEPLAHKEAVDDEWQARTGSRP